jgi:FKBP-type peptidyl-prolyl cis-trans isomerase
MHHRRDDRSKGITMTIIITSYSSPFNVSSAVYTMVLFKSYLIVALALSFCAVRSSALSLEATSSSRRAFLTKTAAATTSAFFIGAATNAPASAAPEVFTTPNGIKYATTKVATTKTIPQNRDIVAIEYTGYLTDGTIFDATHASGKKNALMFEVGGNAVIPGLNEMVENMAVGQKVQAIIPPNLAFGDKGICLETGECLVKPNSTLVYDIFLKTSAIPPP